MLNYLITTEGAWDDGSVRLTPIGITIVAVIIVTLFIIAALVKRGSAKKNAKITTKQLVYSSVAIALAMVCSMIKFADLPMGGSITLFSMLLIVLIGYWYGPYVGILTAVSYGLLQFVMEPIFYTLPQMLVDYPLAFGALGLAGFFSTKKYGLQIGYIVGILGRYFFAVLSGVIFFGSYAPEGTPAIIYSLGYNATYIFTEAILTILILLLPPVKKAMAIGKKLATEN